MRLRRTTRTWVTAILWLLIITFVAVTPSQAVVISWDGELSNDDWFAFEFSDTIPIRIATNWDMDGSSLVIPGAEDSVVFGDTASRVIVDLAGDRSVQTVFFYGNKAYTLNNSTLTVTWGQIAAQGAVTHTINSNVSLGAAGKWIVHSGCTLRLAGSLGGPFNLNKDGSGLLVLAGNNSAYVHDLTVREGTLEVGIGDSVSDTTTLKVLSGATLRVVAAEGMGGISGAGDVVLNATTTVGLNQLDQAISGVISGAGSLTKSGAGTLTLSAANARTGSTIVNAGALLATNTTGSGTGSGPVSVNANATLGGSGSIAGALTVNTDGTVAPGVDLGTLTTGATTFATGSRLAIELAGRGGVPGGDFDRLIVNGAATVQSGAVLDLAYANSFVAAPGDEFVVMTGSGISADFTTVQFPDGQDWYAYRTTSPATLVVGINCPGDADNDGVCDSQDQCPNTVAGAPVDSQGCPSPSIAADFDHDGDVDGDDLAAFTACVTGPLVVAAPACTLQDLDLDGDVDQADFAKLQRCYSGPGIAADLACDGQPSP